MAVTTLLVALGLASVIIVGRQPPPSPNLATPDGVVLAYIQDVQAQRNQDAAALVVTPPTPEKGAGGPGPVPVAPPPRANQPESSARYQILTTQINGDHAVVNLQITTFRADSPVSPSENSYVQVITLTREGGQWKLDQPIYLP